jgi:hypothetical protein
MNRLLIISEKASCTGMGDTIKLLILWKIWVSVLFTREFDFLIPACQKSICITVSRKSSSLTIFQHDFVLLYRIVPQIPLSVFI